MRSRLKRLADGFDRLVAWICGAATALAALALLATLGMIGHAVAMRYVFGRPQVWVDDLVGFLLVAMVMLAAADVMRRGEHIGVDLLTQRLGRGWRRVVAVWAAVAVLVTALFLVVEGWQTAAFSRELGLMTYGQIEIPLHYVQWLLPLGGALLWLAALAVLLRLLLGDAADGDDA
ncbi:MAG: TRAP transporter small permease [Ectothiorhodospiraceae bacterium]|jgi:TRAP-type C4-dicarboxylate transport system permease small subunit|nr:TRAP transporter small permease [Ectothiorhodospiraceae bacterium]